MPKLTIADWSDIKSKLSCVWGAVHLKVDGHLVLAAVRQDKMKLVIFVYVDGRVSGKNIEYFKESEMDSLNDIQKKFMHHKFKGPDPKDVKFYEKLKGKKWCKENGVYDRYFWTHPYFNTPGAFVAKIKKNCESVELLSRSEHDSQLAAMEKERGEA